MSLVSDRSVDVRSEWRILFLEDTPHDASLAISELQRANVAFSSRMVTTEAEFRHAMRDFAPHLILADYSLPSFDGLAALAIAQAACPDVPFIFLSGTIGEEKAVALLKAGATDCVLKHRLVLLAPAVQRALREAKQRAEVRRAAEALREQEQFNKGVLNSLNASLAVLDKSGTIIALNTAWEKLAHQNEETPFICGDVGVNYLDIVSRAQGEGAEGAGQAVAGIRAILDGARPEFTLEYPYRSRGEKRWFLMYVTPLLIVHDGAVIAHYNITERKRGEQERQELASRLRQAEKLASIGKLAASIASDLQKPAPAVSAAAGTAREVPADLNRLLQHYELLLKAATGKIMAPELVAETEATRAQVSEQVVLNLCRLLVALSDFRAQSRPLPRTSSESPTEQQQQLFSALEETIQVLTRTKRSFKSKALGQLRQKLEKLVERGI